MTLRLALLATISPLLAIACTTASSDPEPMGRAEAAARTAATQEALAAPERGVAQPVSAALRDLVSVAGRVPVREGEEPRRIESSLSEEEILRLIAEAQLLPPSDRVQVIQPQLQGQGPVVGTSFDSIDVLECCGSGTLNPPDPELAAGPSHLIAVVNASVEIYDTAGTSLAGPTPLETFFSSLGVGCTIFAFDPNVLYDEDAGRFIVAADGNGTEYCVGVTQTGDPLGLWNFYAFPTDVGGAFFDYPHAGVGRDALYLGGNMFGSGTGRVWALDKVAMYSGQPAAFVTHGLGSNTTPQPVNLHGAAQGTWPTSGPHYILTGRNGFNDPDTFGLFSWADPFGANVLTDLGDLDTVAAHGVPVGFPGNNQQSGGGSITSNDPRPLDFEYRNGSGWMTNAVACNPGGGTVTCVQWVEVDLASAAIAQAGVFASDSVYRFFPDIAADACGDALVGYSKSSASTFPGIAAAGRELGDPPGTMTGEVDIKAGEVTFGQPGRWGDYTGMTIGPDGSTFWYLGEYSKDIASGRNWGTWIAALSFDACSAPIFADGFESGDASAWSAECPPSCV